MKKDQKDSGEDARLNVIIFDEIDSLCRAKGTFNSGMHDNPIS